MVFPSPSPLSVSISPLPPSSNQHSYSEGLMRSVKNLSPLTAPFFSPPLNCISFSLVMEICKASLSPLTSRCHSHSLLATVCLLTAEELQGTSKPRYVRVNTLKLDFDSAFLELSKQHKVQKDDMIQDLLVLPLGSDLHNHPLVINGSVFLQVTVHGRASSMVALALGPKPEWEETRLCTLLHLCKEKES